MTLSNLNPQLTPDPDALLRVDPSSDPLQVIQDLVRRDGDVVRYRSRFAPCFLFVHPDHVQKVLHSSNIRRASLLKMILGEGLLTSDGDFWKAQRRKMQRQFQPRRIEGFGPAMGEETDLIDSEWAAAAGRGTTVDVASDMTKLTLRIVVRTLFSSTLDATLEDSLCEAAMVANSELGRIAWTIFGIPAGLTPGGNAALARARRVIDAFCYDSIAARRSVALDRRPPDLLTLLLEGDGEGETAPLTDQQVRDEMVAMLLAGHETTALALSWAWKAVGELPEVENRLHRELDEAPDDRLTAASVSRLPWTRAVLQETMRLYPPVWSMARAAMAEETIGSHVVPKGACVLLSAWFTHRHPDFWPNAERFDPTRFLDGAPSSLHPNAYIPFGGGRHTCLGMHFAILEGTLVLARLARRFRVRPVAGQQIGRSPGITLRQSPGLVAHIESRGPT